MYNTPMTSLTHPLTPPNLFPILCRSLFSGLSAMSTNKNAFFPPILHLKENSIAQYKFKHFSSLRHDAARLGLMFVGPTVFYWFTTLYYKGKPHGIPQNPGNPFVNRNYRGQKRDMPWGTDCAFLDTHCHEEKGTWAKRGPIFVIA